MLIKYKNAFSGKMNYDQKVFESETQSSSRNSSHRLGEVTKDESEHSEEISGTGCVFNVFLKPKSDLCKT